MDMEMMRRDLAAFADPATEIRVDGKVVYWTQRREQRTLTVLTDHAAVATVLYEGEKYGYRAFIASEHMADLANLAESIQRVVATSAAFVGTEYVESNLVGESGRGESGSEYLEQLVATPIEEKTRVIFIRGRAGDGKSTLLTHVTATQATRYLSGESSWLYLYIDAQASALARIDELLAKAKDDFGAVFSYHAIAVLTRLGLIVPIIDGFDELLGVGGYKDAFSSLGVFIGRLRGTGTVIASARSTFYQYTGFAQQAAKFSAEDIPLAFEVTPVELEPWSPEQAELLLSRIGGSDRGEISAEKILATLRYRLGDKADEIISSPLLLRRVAEYSELIREVNPQSNLVRDLVYEMVKREMREKLLDFAGKPLLSLDQHMALLEALAEEMWLEETRVIDEGTFVALAEVVCEQFGLSGEVAQRFIDRMPTNAFIGRQAGPVRIFFRHELYFGFFVARAVRRDLASGEPIRWFTSRSTVSNTVADELAAVLPDGESGELHCLLVQLNDRKVSRVSLEVVQRNAGTIFAALVRRFGDFLASGRLERADFFGSDFSGTALSEMEFTECTFSEVNLRGAKWTDIEFLNCSFSSVVIDDSSRLEVQGLALPGDVHELRVAAGGAIEYLYNPHEMYEKLVAVGADVRPMAGRRELSREGNRIVVQLELLLQAIQRTVYFSEEDLRRRSLDLKRDVGDAFRRLLDIGLVTKSNKPIKGQRELFKLELSPEDIRRGEAGIYSREDVRRFWEPLWKTASDSGDSERSGPSGGTE